MNRSRPVGALGGGGWEEGSQSGAANHQAPPSGNKKDKVLTEMYEMFLESMEPDIIQSVVQSCGFNAKKSLEALLEMCGGKPTPSKAGQQIRSPVAPLSTSAADATQSPKSSKVRQEENKPQPLMSQSTSSSFQEKKRQSPSVPVVSPSKVSRGVARNSNKDLTPLPPSASSFPYGIKKITNPEYKMGKIRWYIENGKRIMVMMRGCPGSGKSFLAAKLISSYGGKPKDYVFSTDDFFMRRDGYFFVPQNLPEAHQWNQKRVLLKLREGSSPIIIDNTNTQLWEMQVYASFAINNGYALEILEPQTPWCKSLSELSKRNRHGVPRDKIKIMLERYESDITVESLIKSTGAQYSKHPPQPAEHSLHHLSSSRTDNQDLVRTTNYTAGVVRRPEQAFNGLLPHFGNQHVSHVTLKDQESPDSSHTIPKIDGFYFGSSSLQPTIFSSNDANNIPKISSAQSFDSMNASKIKLFPSELTRSAPESNQDPNQIVQAVDIFKTLLTPACKTNDSSVKTSEHEWRTKDAEASISNKLLMPIAGGNQKSGYLSEESDKDCQRDIHKLIASLDCASIDVDECRNGEYPSTSQTSEVSSSANQDSSVFHSEVLPRDSSSCNLPEKKETSVNFLDSSYCSRKISNNTNKNFIALNQGSDWDENRASIKDDSQHQSALPKPPRTLSSKSIQDYCQSVRDINTASQNEASGWSFCENGPISWQPIDKFQEEAFLKEKSKSPPILFDHSQRLKFKKCDVSEKSTNTHHSDFCILSNLSSNSYVKDMKVLRAFDRDINEGRIISPSKTLLKLMLDKGTYTENDFEGETKAESKQEKIKELARLFPNTSQASIKELLKQCQWDVNYVSNLLLDTDNENIITDGGVDEDSDEELEPSRQEQTEELDVSEPANSNGESISAIEETAAAVNVQEEAKEVIRHIEQSIDFSEGYYSPHTLAIKNLRRGQREGAIPKSSQSSVEAAIGLSVESQLENYQGPSVESPVRTSESSDGNEDKETLEFIVGHDFIQQLVDKFGSHCNVTTMSPVVKFPVSLARQIYDVIFTGSSSEEEEDDGDFAMKLQCEEDERMARHLYEEMLQNAHRSGPDHSIPPLREIMDMELAQAIYKADVDSLSQNSPETMAQVLAKRLLEDNYQQVDKKTLHDIFASCNFSFEDTVKTLQEALSTDKDACSEKGRKSQPLDQAIQASVQFQTSRKSPETFMTNKESAQHGCESVEDENPWELTDPQAHHTKYRQQAEEHLKTRDEMYTKASDAFRRGQRSVAAYYAKLGELHGKKYHHANAMAAATLAAAHSNSHSSDTLDLHNYKVVEAVTIFDLYIDHQIGILHESGSQQQCLNIITGRGTHSLHGKPRIKPAILNRVKKRNLRYQPIPSNPGVIKVWVTTSSSLSHEIAD